MNRVALYPSPHSQVRKYLQISITRLMNTTRYTTDSVIYRNIGRFIREIYARNCNSGAILILLYCFFIIVLNLKTYFTLQIFFSLLFDY